MIVSYRTHYPTTDGLIKVGARCIQTDSSTNDGMMALIDEVLKSIHGLCVILHNASVWVTEKPGASLTDVLVCMIQIHASILYLLSHILERLLREHGHTTSGITHFIDYVVGCDSDKHITYAVSKAASGNVTRSSARRLAPGVKVNSITPSLILFNEHDDAGCRRQALNKSLMKTAPGEEEVIDLVDHLLTNCFVIGRSPLLDDDRHLRQCNLVQHIISIHALIPQHATELTKAADKRIVPMKYHRDIR